MVAKTPRVGKAMTSMFAARSPGADERPWRRKGEASTATSAYRMPDGSQNAAAINRMPARNPDSVLPQLTKRTRSASASPKNVMARKPGKFSSAK